MAAPGALDQPDQSDQGGEGDDFSDEDAGADDLVEDGSIAVSEPILSESPASVAPGFEPRPLPPEEPAYPFARQLRTQAESALRAGRAR